MGFKLVRPCPHCPFRRDHPGFLTQARAREIADALLRGDQTFACHETLGDTEDDDLGVVPGSQHCAGALAFVAAQPNGWRNAMLQIAQRLGLYDPTKLDPLAPVITTRLEFMAHHDYRRNIEVETTVPDTTSEVPVVSYSVLTIRVYRVDDTTYRAVDETDGPDLIGPEAFGSTAAAAAAGVVAQLQAMDEDDAREEADPAFQEMILRVAQEVPTRTISGGDHET